MGLVVQVEVKWNYDLERVLQALGASYGYGSAGRLVVDVTALLDGALEELVAALGELRWGYDPGRRLELQLGLPGMEAVAYDGLPLLREVASGG